MVAPFDTDTNTLSSVCAIDSKLRSSKELNTSSQTEDDSSAFEPMTRSAKKHDNLRQMDVDEETLTSSQ